MHVDCKHSKNSVISLFSSQEHNKHEDIMTYRDRAHRSVLTGTMAPLHHTPWIKAMDDSMSSFLNNS